MFELSDRQLLDAAALAFNPEWKKRGKFDGRFEEKWSGTAGQVLLLDGLGQARPNTSYFDGGIDFRVPLLTPKFTFGQPDPQTHLGIDLKMYPAYRSGGKEWSADYIQRSLSWFVATDQMTETFLYEQTLFGVQHWIGGLPRASQFVGFISRMRLEGLPVLSEGYIIKRPTFEWALKTDCVEVKPEMLTPFVFSHDMLYSMYQSLGL